MLFSNQKIFLDVKDYSKIGQLEAAIRQFGGTIEKFLSKEITCVVTNRERTEGLSLQKDVSASAHSQSFRPSASGGRVLSRGQALLMHSNSLKDTSVCEPVAFAEMWGIKIITLDTIVQAIDRQLQACSPSSSPVTKQPIKPHRVVKKTNFVGAFIKVEDTESNFRPFFSQYLTFPRLDLEGDLSNGIFRCAETVRPVAVRMNVSAPAASTRKQKASCRRGYCECCDTMYDELGQHLTSAGHQRFAENVENFADLDKLINEICSSDGIGTSLPDKDCGTQDVASEARSSRCEEEIRFSHCSNPSTVAAESASSHNECLGQNQPSGQHGKPEDSAEVADIVQNCTESRGISVEETSRYCRSPLQPSNGVDTHSVNSESPHADNSTDRIKDTSQSPKLEAHCNAGIALSAASVAVTSPVDTHKTTEAGILKGGNPTNSDDMPQFLSSDCVVNLLELLSSENSVDSTLHVEEAGCHAGVTSEKHTAVAPVNSLVSPRVASVCSGSSDTVCNEVSPCEPRHCQPATTVASVGAECSFSLALMQNDLLDARYSAGMMERCSAIGDKFRTNCEHVSNTVTLPNLSDVTILPPTDVVVSKDSLISNDEMNHDDARTSCDMKVDCDASVFQSSPSYVHQPSPCTVPVYASSGVNNSPVFDDCAFLPVHSDLTADSFDLHNKLLATVYASDVAEQDRQQNFSSAPVGSDIIADCFDLHDKLLTMGYASDVAERDRQRNGSSSHASYPSSADYVAASTSVNNLCLPMTFSPPLCISEGSGLPADCTDASLCTPVHSPSHLLESPATFSTFSADISTERASLCRSSPVSGFSYLAGSTEVSDGLQGSVPCTGSRRNSEVNSVGNKQEQADLHIDSGPCTASDTDVKHMTAKCTSMHVAEDCDQSTSVDTVRLESRFVDNISCCVKPSISGLDSVMSPCSAASLRSQVNSASPAAVPEPCDSTEPVGTDAGSDNDCACTVMYNCDCLASSLLEPASHRCSPGKSEPEASVEYREPFVSSANSTWKVVSCADCRMKLVRTEAVFPVAFAENNAEVKSRSSVLGPELQCIGEPSGKADANNDNKSAVVCDCVISSIRMHAGERPPCENETETNVDPSVSSTWKVTSFVDCRMKLVRSTAVFPTLCGQTVSSDSRHCYAKNFCNTTSKLILSNVADSVLTC